MYTILDESIRSELLISHKTERDKRIADRMKAVLLYDDGWTPPRIAAVLMLEEGTVRRHLNSYEEERKLKPSYKGSQAKLNEEESKCLSDHLESTTFVKIKDIQDYVEVTFQKRLGISTLYKWLTKHGFSYKKPKLVPKKVDPLKQQAFIEKYEKIMNEAALSGDPVLFDETLPCIRDLLI